MRDPAADLPPQGNSDFMSRALHTETQEQPRGLRSWRGSIRAVFLGLLIGLFGGFLQASTVSVGPVELPLWATFVAVTLVVVTRAFTTTYLSRVPGAFFVGTWLLLTIFLTFPLPGGDIVIATSEGSWISIYYLFLGGVVAFATAMLPAHLRPEAVETA